MENTSKALLELLKASLFDFEPEFPTDIDWNAILLEAKAQTVVALAAKAVPTAYASQWRIYDFQSQARFVRVLHGQKQLEELLAGAEVPLAILKGTAAAMYYPEPFRRMMGDVDFLVPPDMFDETACLMEANGYKALHELQSQLSTSTRPRHIVFCKDGIDYELHHHFGGEDIKEAMISGLQNAEVAIIGEISFPVMPPMENGLVLLAHAASHLESAGLGLRHVIDWMMFVHRELDDDRWENCFRKYAENAGLKRLAIVLTRLCRDYLGLPGEYNWCDEADEQLVKKLLDLIFERGNFGRKLGRPQTVEYYATEIRSKGLFPFIKLISKVVWCSPRVQNSMFILRPLTWIQEFFRRFRERITERPNHLMEDMNRSSELLDLYKELEIK